MQLINRFTSCSKDSSVQITFLSQLLNCYGLVLCTHYGCWPLIMLLGPTYLPQVGIPTWKQGSKADRFITLFHCEDECQFMASVSGVTFQIFLEFNKIIICTLHDTQKLYITVQWLVFLFIYGIPQVPISAHIPSDIIISSYFLLHIQNPCKSWRKCIGNTGRLL